MKHTEKLKKGDIIKHAGKFWLLVDWCPPCRKLWLQGVSETKTALYKNATLVKVK